MSDEPEPYVDVVVAGENLVFTVENPLASDTPTPEPTWGEVLASIIGK